MVVVDQKIIRIKTIDKNCKKKLNEMINLSNLKKINFQSSEERKEISQ